MMQRMFFRRRSLAMLLFVLSIFCPSPILFALDCGACGAKDFPDLTMVCPKCNRDLHGTRSRLQARSTAILQIEILYVGNRPERLPDYAKLFINRKYRGNINILERENREGLQLEPGRNGLGVDYTALYRHELRNLDAGLFHVQIEMLFPRLSGYLHSLRRVDFPRISLKSGEKTVIRHVFKSPDTFSKKGQKFDGKVKDEFGLPLILSTGTVSIEIPLLK